MALEVIVMAICLMMTDESVPLSSLAFCAKAGHNDHPCMSHLPHLLFSLLLHRVKPSPTFFSASFVISSITTSSDFVF